jgi:hypothetical protein
MAPQFGQCKTAVADWAFDLEPLAIIAHFMTGQSTVAASGEKVIPITGKRRF